MVLAYDLLAVPDGYLLSAWNRLDLAIVVLALLALCPETSHLAPLRLLRVLRPLRLLSRSAGGMTPATLTPYGRDRTASLRDTSPLP